MTETTATPPAVKKPKPYHRLPGRCIRLSDVPWSMYTKLSKAFDGHQHVRITYDRGEMEIMAPSFEHEDDADVLGYLAVILIEELGLPIRRGGAVTLRRRRPLRGIEPDRCYWIANALRLAGVRKLDLRIHPPPDLAIEVDVTRNSLNRMAIHATVGIGEVWRLDGDTLFFHVLGADRRYVEVPTSSVFPGLTPSDLLPALLQARGAADQSPATRAFRAWARNWVAARTLPPAQGEAHP